MVKMNEEPETYWREHAGPKWVRARHAVDYIVSPITDHLLAVADAKEGERVIDIGCGCGTTTLAFAKQVGPSGHVLGVDVSDPMLEVTRSAAAEIPQLDVALADAGSHSFSPEANLLASRFGVMFFPDPPAAFANMRSALAPGGRTALICWQPIERNPWISHIMRAFPEAAPAMPDPDAGPGPFSLSDPERTRDLLTTAGFKAVAVESFETTVSLGETAEKALEAMTEVGGFSRMLAEAENDEHRVRLNERARAFLDDEYQGGAPQLDAAVWVLRART
ncbi:MAG: class I SAM-dependent methyltransferase [Nannocystales bacterium]